MKFYYNGKLVRTSKTNDYKYAILNSAGECKGCSASEAGIQNIFRQITKNGDGWNDNYKAVLAGTFESKKDGWSESDIRKWFASDDEIRDAVKKWETYRAGLKIVKLERK